SLAPGHAQAMSPATPTAHPGALLRSRLLARAGDGLRRGHGDPTDLGDELVVVEPRSGLSPMEGRQLEVAVLGPERQDADDVAKLAPDDVAAFIRAELDRAGFPHAVFTADALALVVRT